MAETIIAIPRRENGKLYLQGATPHDEELLSDLPSGKEGKFDVSFPRNLKFHKKFFALLGVILSYMDEETKIRLNVFEKKQLLIRIKLDLGLYTLFVATGGGAVPEGTPVFIPDSINFFNMEETKFVRLYKDTIGVAIGKYVSSNLSEDSIDEAVRAVLRFE